MGILPPIAGRVCVLVNENSQTEIEFFFIFLFYPFLVSLSSPLICSLSLSIPHSPSLSLTCSTALFSLSLTLSTRVFASLTNHLYDLSHSLLRMLYCGANANAITFTYLLPYRSHTYNASTYQLSCISLVYATHTHTYHSLLKNTNALYGIKTVENWKTSTYSIRIPTPSKYLAYTYTYIPNICNIDPTDIVTISPPLYLSYTQTFTHPLRLKLYRTSSLCHRLPSAYNSLHVTIPLSPSLFIFLAQCIPLSLSMYLFLTLLYVSSNVYLAFSIILSHSTSFSPSLSLSISLSHNVSVALSLLFKCQSISVENSNETRNQFNKSFAIILKFKKAQKTKQHLEQKLVQQITPPSLIGCQCCP